MVGEEGDNALTEEQTALRRKTAEVRALRMNTTQTEARVEAMRLFTQQRYAELKERRRKIAEEKVQRFACYMRDGNTTRNTLA